MSFKSLFEIRLEGLSYEEGFVQTLKHFSDFDQSGK